MSSLLAILTDPAVDDKVGVGGVCASLEPQGLLRLLWGWGACRLTSHLLLGTGERDLDELQGVDAGIDVALALVGRQVAELVHLGLADFDLFKVRGALLVELGVHGGADHGAHVGRQAHLAKRVEQ